MLYNITHRYTIQIMDLDEREPRWSHFYSSRSSATLRSARKELNRWRNHQWDFVNDNPRFRAFDNKKRQAVDF